MADPAAKEDPKNLNEETEEKVSPGLDPSPDPKVVVNAVNPPITPDQVVSMAESPSAATLPDVKLQNIKISPVKNKTIQGHLAAIEAKMIATEKLMKDVVKLQKQQISTEKELHQRRRELYQNTFEEYLLDKTIGFEDPESSNLSKLVKQKSDKDDGSGGNMPLLNPLRRNANKNRNRNTNRNINRNTNVNKPGTKPPVKPGTKPPVTPKVNPLTKTTPQQPPGKIINPATGKPFPPKPGATVNQPFSSTPARAPSIPKAPVTPKTPTLPSLSNLRPTVRGTGNVAMLLAPLVLGEVQSHLFEKDIQRLLILKEENIFEYDNEIEKIRSNARNTGFLNPILGSFGMGNDEPILKLKTLGELKEADLPPPSLVDAIQHTSGRGKPNPLMPSVRNLVPDLNEDGTKYTVPPKENKTPEKKASGGINDVNLYHSSSQQYFRDVSSKLEIPKFAGGGLLDMLTPPWAKPKGLSTAGARPGFTGMNSQGYNAITGGDKFRPGGFKPQILGRGAYSAPTQQGAMRYAGGQSSLGMPQQPGGVVKTIVPGGAPRFPFLEQQMKVKPTTFDKGRVLANKVQSGAYPRSNLAGRMRTGMRMGGAPMRMSVPKVPKLSHPFVMLAEMIINELVSPQSTAVYDQVTGPNAYYNAPGYKGPMPSQNLENAQNTMMDGTSNQQPQIVPLPADYIKLPGKPKEKTYNTFEVPGIDLEPSMFTRPSRYID